MKYFKFKRLNKRRKIDFIVFLLGGCFFIFSAIINCNIWQGLFGFVMLVECLDIYNDQVNSDIINGYEKMVRDLHKIFELQLNTTRDMIRSKDEESLNKFADTIDNIYKEEIKNDSNEGK